MLQIASALRGSTVQAEDGSIGHVTDFLFDDRTWALRWIVVEAGTWLIGRRVLLHPSAIIDSSTEAQIIRVNLTTKQVEASPSIRDDQPVSMQDENNLYGYYGWDPSWGAIGGGGLGFPLIMPIQPTTRAGVVLRPGSDGAQDSDPHLRSIRSVTGYHVHATDGMIGHIEGFLLDDVGWAVRYLAINTSNWWSGREVLLAPQAITKIVWADREVWVHVSRDQVKSSPPWCEDDMVGPAFEAQLHDHYGWASGIGAIAPSSDPFAPARGDHEGVQGL